MSWRLGRFAGIAVYMHPTFLLLLAFVAWQHWRIGHSLAAMASGVAFILALFGCVVLHEFGHALTAGASAYGPRTSRSSPSAAWPGSSACRTIPCRSYG